jgi:hypothetical protein
MSRVTGEGVIKRSNPRPGEELPLKGLSLLFVIEQLTAVLRSHGQVDGATPSKAIDELSREQEPRDPLLGRQEALPDELKGLSYDNEPARALLDPWTCGVLRDRVRAGTAIEHDQATERGFER